MMSARLFRRSRGAADLIVPAFGLIVVALIFVATAKEILWEANRDMNTLSRQAAKELAGEVSALSATEQGVRFYEVRWEFSVDLEADKVSVSYTNEDKKTVSYSFPHTAGSIVIPASVGGPARLCISKKLDGCTPKVTLCKDTESCCSLSQSKCFFSG